MAPIPIYTIGYGNRSFGDFVKLLQHYEIKFLVDIRSQPYSRFNPDYSKDALERRINSPLMRYIFMGDTLGGRPKDSSCYIDNKVDYKRVREKPFFQRGIAYLHTAWEKQLRIALMCSEAKPQECHRTKLIGNILTEQNIDVAHIDETGAIKTQAQINHMIQKLSDEQPSFFSDESLASMSKKVGQSRKKYTFSDDGEG